MGAFGDRTRTPPWDALAVLAAKAAVSALILASGFVAFSDDDFSRVVIAEGFAHAPRLDASQTSWLPLPFWLTGGAMAALGRTLGVARAVALAEGLVSALLVHRAGRFLGFSRSGAVLGAVVATSIPTAARLGVSFQPEALTAGLVVLGAAATRADGSRRLVGAACLAAACLCRYEAWPAAAAFAALSARDALSSASPRRHALGAAMALAAPLLWILHGVHAHGDALFFAHRVATYRAALGVHESAGRALAAYPVLLVTAEPELVLFALAALGLAVARGGPRGAGLAPLRRPVLVLGSVLACLILGRLLGGAPTHHAERTLLPLWGGIALVTAEEVARLFRTARARSVLVLSALAASAGTAVRLSRPAEAWQARAAERSIGEAARTALGPAARLLVDTPDYGYFAVIAAFGAPERAEPLERHDPRIPAGPDAFASTDALGSRADARGAAALVVHHEHWPVALPLGRLVSTRSDLALVLVARPERPLR